MPLHLVSTPIGNRKDLTLRSIDLLKSVAYILCEDTRHSAPLLHFFEISVPLHPYHKFNEAKVEEKILRDLLDGQEIALISDAGSPGIADPSSRLVRLCHDHQIPVTVLPGPCAVIAALQLSGWDSQRFQFVSFLPRTHTHLALALEEYLAYSGVTVAYESPHRILKTIQTIATLAPDHKIGIARELTKQYEEWQEGTAQELTLLLQAKEVIRGEFVLLLSPRNQEHAAASATALIALSPEEEVLQLIALNHTSLAEACKQVASRRSLSRKTLYKSTLTLMESNETQILTEE